jgi:hypothetical protein
VGSLWKFPLPIRKYTFTREPWGIAGDPSALLGRKISQTPYSFWK